MICLVPSSSSLGISPLIPVVSPASTVTEIRCFLSISAIPEPAHPVYLVTIGKLSALTELSIVPGRIMGALRENISQLKDLRFRAISRNFISGEIPASLGEVRGLRALDLSYNQLTGTISPSIGSLPELSNLILCHNHLTGSIPPFLSQTLTRIDLKRNSLTGSISPASLPPSLQYLSLAWNQLTGPVDRVLLRLNQLNYLDLSLNRLTGIIPGRIVAFPITNLQLQRYFFLNSNRFTGEVPASFVERLLSASIQTLYLQHNFLTGIQISPAAEIPVSSSLCLQYTVWYRRCPLKAGPQKTRPTT
ncbi:LRR receptor-like serine/threonine-protein kinase SIK1 [Cardamine amara subsp. amara]|uniref:LRR receptor-like serine/threonine-protein kinase SIK1 n=1 Tax=Cardamine amara subsp. amara TaxID=228776 RepID=A0ABD1BCB6_CARAN